MKTLSNISRLAVVALVSGTLSVHMMSCSKDSEVQPSVTTITTPVPPATTEPPSGQPTVTPASPFTDPAKYAVQHAKKGLLLLMTNQGSSFKSSKYMIEIFDDGTVNWKGNSGTAVKAETFKLDLFDMKLLRRAFDVNHFEEMKSKYSAIPILNKQSLTTITFKTCTVEKCDNYKIVQVFGNAPDDLSQILHTLNGILHLQGLVGSQPFPEISVK